MTTPAVESTSGTWHDQAPEVATEAANRLRLNPSDPDRDRLEQQARAACRQIDRRLGLRPATGRWAYQVQPGDVVTTYGTGEAPDDVLEAAVIVAMDLFRRKDAPFGVLNASSVTAEPVRISRDPLAGAASLLEPYVETWGLA